MDTKTCTICNKTATLNLFCASKNLCKECNKLKCKEYRESNRERQSEYNKKYRNEHKEEISTRMCEWSKNNRDKRRIVDAKYKESHRRELSEKQQEYYRGNKEVIAIRTKAWNEDNKNEISSRRKISYDANRDEILARAKQNRNSNIDEVRKQRNQYLRKLRNTNENYAISVKLRSSLSKALKKQGIVKTFSSGVTTRKAAEIVSNIGSRPKGFHLDHIIPISAFDLRNQLHRELAMSKYNLRWISADENLRKNKTIDYEIINSNEELSKIAKIIGLVRD